jgi:transcriptional regulator with XRE-family HTH domain
MNDFGLRLKELRKKSGLTQEKLAESLGVSYQAVSKWETGAAIPDLSLIIPLAKQFHVSTDDLLGYTDHRAELESLWQNAVRLGELETLRVSEEALKEYPHDQIFLYRRACDEFFCGKNTPDEALKREYLERSVRHYKALIAEYPEFDAVGMLVLVLSELGQYDEARTYAQNQPDRDLLLKHCLTGEELQKHCQKLTEEALQKLVREMLGCNSYASLQAAEDIINLIFSDGNYLDYYGSLMGICQRRAKLLIAENRLGEAVEMLQKALQYTQQRGKLKGKLPYTAPIFDRLTFDTSAAELVLAEAFRARLTSPDFDALRDRADFIALAKEAE